MILELYCEKCETRLPIRRDETKKDRIQITLLVEPCQVCLHNERIKSFNEGVASYKSPIPFDA